MTQRKTWLCVVRLLRAVVKFTDTFESRSIAVLSARRRSRLVVLGDGRDIADQQYLWLVTTSSSSSSRRLVFASFVTPVQDFPPFGGSKASLLLLLMGVTHKGRSMHFPIFIEATPPLLFSSFPFSISIEIPRSITKAYHSVSSQSLLASLTLFNHHTTQCIAQPLSSSHSLSSVPVPSTASLSHKMSKSQSTQA